MNSYKWIIYIAVASLGFGCVHFASADVTQPLMSPTPPRKIDKMQARTAEQVAQLKLPEDTSPQFVARQLSLGGNTLITTEQLYENMPLVFNASEKPLADAEAEHLYDLRVLHEIIQNPGEPRQVSARTIQGFTQYILSAYQRYNYAGIYVYMPTETIVKKTKLENDILRIEVIEAIVSDLAVTHYDAEHNKMEKGRLPSSVVMDWSPVEVGKVANEKKLNDFVNLLNLNPDRYVSAVVSEGPEKKTLAVGYEVFEANPWHYFIQVDNSGTKDRQWTPKIGVINTNLLGIDDRFTAVYQSPWESDWDENYAVYGSYDFPLFIPRLRLNLYASHNEFDISPEGGIFDFLGRGTFAGGILRYNLIQSNGWFFDIKGSVEYVRSRVTPSLFPEELGTDLKFWLWGAGVDLYRRDDFSDTRLTLERFQSMCQDNNRAEFSLARRNADPDFAIYNILFLHNQFLDTNKIQRFRGLVRWVGSSERVVPAMMTAFGGMYTVRGYDELEAVADGGLLVSGQYEFDLVRYDRFKETEETEQQDEPDSKKLRLRKLAPLAFIDYGRPKIRESVGAEDTYEELFSIGIGLLAEVGENLSGAVYYGYPLIATDETRSGKGRVNAGFMLRW